MPGGAKGRVKATFDEGLQQIYSLIDRNPDQQFGFLPDTAYEVLNSKLIAFEPDLWLDRAAQLAPIRTERKNALLPVHVRFRLEELFRSYVFGCWLSVFALARALLEYAILDNLHKFDIDRLWPRDREGKRRRETGAFDRRHRQPSAATQGANEQVAYVRQRVLAPDALEAE
jgi:hypothetical protein